MILENELLSLAKMIGEWIRAGARTDEIQARLAAPTSVAAELLDRAVARRVAGEAYMGRMDPLGARVAEEPPKPAKGKAKGK